MNKLTKLVAVLLATSPVVTKAQGFQVNLQGQAQQGMGGAGTAVMQDANAVFFNPGGMSFIKGNAVELGMTPTFANGQFLDANTGANPRTTSPTSTPFSAYAMYGGKDSTKFFGKMKLGLGVYTPFGSTVDWEEGWTGRYTLTHLQLKAIFIQPTVSYKLHKMVGIGAGFNIVSGAVNLQKDIPVVDNDGNVGHAELSGKAMAYGVNAGVYFTPIKQLSVGLTYRSKIKMNVKDGDATFTVPSSLDANFPDQKFSSTLPLPQVITLGIGVKPIDKLDIALDINHVGWKAYDTLAFDYEKNTSSLADTKSPRNYKDIIALRFGVQYKIIESLAVRAGIAYGQTPVQDGYVTPETPDNNRINYTFGVGYTIKNKFGINASFLYTSIKRTDTNIETQLSGTFHTKVVAPGLSLSYKF